MLNFLNKILEFIFYYGVPIFFGLGVLCSFIFAIFILSQYKKGFSYIENGCCMLVVCGLFYSFFLFRDEFVDIQTSQDDIMEIKDDGEIIRMSEKQQMLIPYFLAAGSSIVCGIVVFILKQCLVPYVVLVFLVWGVILFGW